MSKNLECQLIPATSNDYFTLQNLARFYVYDMSRYCGFLPHWECPENGLYEAYDFESYFIESHRYPFLVRVNHELAGFVLVNKMGLTADTDWNIAEFFITAKFQHRGIGQKIAKQLWQQYPGKWQVSVLPQNERGLQFWRKAISEFTKNQFSETTQKVGYDPDNPRVIFNFAT